MVYPQGLNGSWNAGTCCRASSQRIFDDADFIKTVLVKLENDLAVNDSRVYVAGESNGGMLAYRLACDFPEDFAAIAAVSATSVVTERCNATSPVSVMAIQGTADTVIPYNNSTRSSSDLPVPPTVNAISYWAQRDGTVSESQQQVGNNTVTTYGGGSNGTEVVLYTVNGGTHGWLPEIPTTNLIWRFFELHPRQSA